MHVNALPHRLKTFYVLAQLLWDIALASTLWDISADRCSMNRASSTAYAREGTADETEDLQIDQEWIDIESGDETAVQPAAAQ